MSTDKTESDPNASINNGKYRDAEQKLSPHHDQRSDPTDISVLVVHGISLPAGEFGQPYIDQLFMGTLDPEVHPTFAILKGLRVSAHMVIHRDGRIVQYVPFHLRAWHAGISHYCGRRGCNDFAIGIELEGTDTEPYTKEQYQQLARVAAALVEHYPALTAQRIVGHQHIAPVRKTDPGPAFDWQHFKQLVNQQLHSEDD
ncbi:1,6-anhydro-N-acetylmuramyl-L-alanine amidase AmpD [Pseudidiomarina sp. 1APR75-33.1]|uniref:1,6-anhydro-N-acetylmuramyl-L-alanine amidase AmpD n=1 Tax=Pseudidiomarina terrestris TaxID=2820060 RepID=UPI00265048E8|nr:1,6-anhydro-N-acetylmuramyl-L-alanine amidase AmpD [Pseudidiomarina sp. 1APR75-33.1]MDN7126354.1 1,6-anhydro-N-acetylmuramyl-L-alanine amidase AmpD [Pseudidiomarina sp. 1APR75-33.1]